MSAPTRVANPPTEVPVPFKFDPIEEAIAAIKNGEFVAVMDDEDRENEADLICSAAKVTTEGMAWFVKWTSGYVCLSTTQKRSTESNLTPLLSSAGANEDAKGTAYHLTIDANAAKHPVHTGISAHDRALCSRLVAEGAPADDFTRPGHIMTLRYTPGGVRNRTGHTEAAVDSCYLADSPPAGSSCELVHPTDPAGSMARRDDSWKFAREWGLKVISIADSQAYLNSEKGAKVPTA